VIRDLDFNVSVRFADITKIWGELLNKSWKILVGNVLTVFNYRIDLFITALLLTIHDVGIYALAVTLSKLIWFIPGAVQYVVLPKVAEKDPSDKVKSKIFIITTCKYSFILVLAVSLIFVVFCYFFIPILYTETYRESIQPLIILLIGGVAYALVKPLSASLFGAGITSIAIYISSIGISIQIVLSLLFAPLFGLNGIALASSIGYISNLVVVMHFITREFNINYHDIFSITKEDISNLVSLVKDNIIVWKKSNE
jgi:O-antigen/teichoic acid export membrane protein